MKFTDKTIEKEPKLNGCCRYLFVIETTAQLSKVVGIYDFYNHDILTEQ